MSAAEFLPPRLIRGPHLQSLLGSSSLRALALGRRRRRLEDSARALIVEAGDGVRLSGFLNLPGAQAPSGLAVLLHGWEGSARSLYLVDAASALLSAGWAVFRLEFRDHGDSHHLNPELFHSCRLAEVVGAFRWIASNYPWRPLVAVGFSLGGNFALRVALRAPEAGIPLASVQAICPVIDPAHGLAAIERAPWFYERYFLAKWRASLKRKRERFPELYRFSDRTLRKGLRELTAWLVREYTDFPSLDAYLEGYSVAGSRLLDLEVPTQIITSADDPIIPVEDFLALRLGKHTRLRILPHGGHCAFLADYALRSFAPRAIVEALDALPQCGSDADAPLAENGSRG